MRVLIACEYSGRTREAFRRRGHDAWSCDLLPADDGSMFHYAGDVRLILDCGWDLMIAHPPCTYLTWSAEWAYKDGPYHQRVKRGTLVGAARRRAREEAAEFFLDLYYSSIPRVAIENPVGYMSKCFRKPDQYIQPWQFGDDASKKTCLWLRNLPLLKRDPKIFHPGRMVEWPPGSGKMVRRWSNQTDSGHNKLRDTDDRWKERSVTYRGWAEAFADQWGSLPPLRNTNDP